MGVKNLPNDHVEYLLKLPEDEFYRLLGNDLVGRQALPMDPRELTERGKRWFQAQAPKLRSKICNDENLKSLATKENIAAAIVIEVANLLAGLVFTVSLVTLASLIVKKGLKSFCDPVWQEEDNNND